MNTPSSWGFWRRRTLRFWLGMGMLLNVLPLAVAAIGGYLYIDRQAVRPLAAMVQQERAVLDPLQDMTRRFWDATVALKNFRVEGDRRSAEVFRDQATAIQSSLNSLQVAVGDGTPAAASLAIARRHWGQALRTGQTLMTLPRGAAVAEATSRMDAFELSARRADGALIDMHNDLLRRLEARRERVREAREWMRLMAWVAAGAALLLGAAGMVLVDRTVVDRVRALAAGVTRAAAGDGREPVQATLLPELAQVAGAFNRMGEYFANQERKLALLARTDGLTGLDNRREFDIELAEHLARAKRFGGKVGLLMIDIDHFKAFNDRFGHQGGDLALRAIAVALVATLRDVDRPFRYGGEEFAVILPASDPEGARLTAERLRGRIAERVIGLAEGRKGNVTVSIGVAVYPDTDGGPESLVAAADAALYRAKEEGRDRVCMA